MTKPDPLTAIRARMEAFVEELEREYYLEGAGLKDAVNASAIYERYPDLASRSLLEMLEEELGSVRAAAGWSLEAERRRRLEYLRETVAQAYLANTVRDLSDAMLNREAAGMIRVSGETGDMPFRSSAIALVNEERRSRRAAISMARDAFTADQLNPLLREAHGRVAEELSRVGSRNYAGVVQEMSGIDLVDLHATTEAFLRSTETMYRDVLKWSARKHLGVGLEDLQKHDLAYLSRGGAFDRHFPAGSMAEKILDFVGAMGIDPEAGGRIRLDLEARPRKSPRAFCSPVRVPDEIYLVIRPAGGVDDYKAFLHELGHALHFGYITPALTWEYRRLGDHSVTEGYAMTFDHLAQNPVWLRRVLGWQEARSYLQHAVLVELMMLRRYAAKLSYELVLHDGRPLDGKEEVYRRFLSDATLAAYSPAHYLADVDPFFYCARYLRAWMVESMLSRHLTENFNDDWFLNPRAGELLKELWGQGQKYRAEELMRTLAYPNLTMEFITMRLETLLGKDV